MSLDQRFAIALVVMAAASYLCRAGGFFFMRFVALTPRREAALRALPIGVMTGIMAPVVLQGRVPECAGLAAAILVMKASGSDLAAALAGVAVVALLRQSL
ncbi:AzlD family protein [Bosea sp. 2RAB26]|uniref:AzlD family protein n=1 Tax=Bosea sp. 2RAB26 TaxID=3237476 RepID=UPI003F8E8483